MVSKRIFVNREKELSYLENWLSTFPKPSISVNRRRDILFITGAKGIGKSALLREFQDRSRDSDRIVVYIEFRRPYRSVEQFIQDIIEHYYRALSLHSSRLEEIVLNILLDIAKTLVKKVGLDLDTISYTIASSKKYKEDPLRLITLLEEKLSYIAYREDKKLVIIYDEFQNLVKTLTTEDRDYIVFVEDLLNYMSKVQEWGFNTRYNGYCIYIISSSDYTLYRSIARSHLWDIVSTYHINELSIKDSIKLLEEYCRLYDIVLSGDTPHYIASFLGGNPALLIKLILRFKEKGYSSVTREAVDRELESIINYEVFRLKDVGRRLGIDLCTIYKCIGSRVVSQEEFEDKLFNELGSGEKIEYVINELLKENIISWIDYRLQYQNRLIERALERLCR